VDRNSATDDATGFALWIGLTLQNLSMTAGDDLVVRQATAKGRADANTPDFFDVGKCLAKGSLEHTLPLFRSLDVALPTGGDGGSGGIILVDQAQVPVKKHFFAAYEFTVEWQDKTKGPIHFILRSATSPNNDLYTLTSSPPAGVPAGDGLIGNARGTWPYSKVQVDLQEPYIVNGSGHQSPSLIQLAYRSDSKPYMISKDFECFTSANAIPNPPSDIKANKGIFGVDYDAVRIVASNPLSVDKTVHVRVGTDRPGRVSSPVSALVGAVDFGFGVRGCPNDDQKFMFSPDQSVIPAYENDPVPMTALDIPVKAGTTASGSFRFQVGDASSTPWYVILYDD